MKRKSAEKLHLLLTCSVRRPPTLPASQDFVKGYTYLHYSLKKRGGQGGDRQNKLKLKSITISKLCEL